MIVSYSKSGQCCSIEKFPYNMNRNLTLSMQLAVITLLTSHFQITGIRFPLLGNDLSLPLFQTMYLGHPACHSFDGDALAEKIFELLKRFGLSVKEQQSRNVGGVFDGQYLNLNVIQCLGEWFSVLDYFNIVYFKVAYSIILNLNPVKAIIPQF